MFPAQQAEIPPGLSEVKSRIEAAARAAKRETSNITLIAVSKTFPAQEITPFLKAGQETLGSTF